MSTDSQASNGAAASDSLLTDDKKILDAQNMDGDNVKRNTTRTQWKQWAACISATLSMVAAGTVYGWTTTTKPQFVNKTKSYASFDVSEDEFSWVISITVIGSMVGALYGAYVTTSLGRRTCLLMTSIFYIAGWLLVITAQRVWFLYVSRFILGIGVGMSYTANPTYISEVADVNIRGALSTLTAVNVFAGSLIACSIGPWFSYQVLNFSLLSIPLLFILTFAWFPETPYFLVNKGRDAQAEKAIGFFKGISNQDELQKELDEVRRNIGDDTDSELKFKLQDILLLKKVRNLRALCIVMGLILGQQMSGNFATMQYVEDVFPKDNAVINSHVATIIVIAVGLAAGTLSTLTVEEAGRRRLLLFSSFACAITLAALGIYMTVSSEGADMKSVNLIPLIDLTIFQVVYQIGLGTMPNLLIGELFPTNVKGIAGAIITIFDGLMSFTVTKLFPSVAQGTMFLIFSGSCFILFIFIYGFIPETKCKTFHEIQEILGDLRPFRVSEKQTKCCQANDSNVNRQDA
ncbi:hypothetical protein QAD02_014945 [Eretmocerus hayati]|uniref:Uncharacterized protein n=1 Tax=Eretmocerus hayati TaxID=131215 RepID=A0ACC2P7T5_9HYME|nr:hypothetical protein QAD02_014945 [Eretmocerus hayati]